MTADRTWIVLGAIAVVVGRCDHRLGPPPLLGVAGYATRAPASTISPSARSPSPGARSTAAIAPLSTRRLEAEPAGVEHGAADAVIGRQAADHDARHAALAQERLELASACSAPVIGSRIVKPE